MSFSSLPRELVDAICSQITHQSSHRRCGKSIQLKAQSAPINEALDTVFDVDTLLALCLVSRQILPSARRYLYRQPLDETLIDSNTTWKQALKLLDALRANEKMLGRLVHDVSDVRSWAFSLAIVRQPKGFSEVVKGINDWYCSLIEACPNLRHVELSISSREDLKRICKALHSLSPLSTSFSNGYPTRTHPLRSLTLAEDFRDPPRNFEISHLDFFDLLRQSSIQILDTLTVSNIRWSPLMPTPDTPCHLPSQIKELSLSNQRFESCPPLFPQNPPSTRATIFYGTTASDGLELIKLRTLSTSKIWFLGMRFFVRPKSTLETYHLPSTSPRILPEAFATFPHLSYLNLIQAHGPSLLLLQTLVKTSPLLARLRFLDSRWVCSHNYLSTNPDDIFPEQEILDTLTKFPLFEELHLGILPTTDPLRYEGFKTRLEEGGIPSRYQICEKE